MMRQPCDNEALGPATCLSEGEVLSDVVGEIPCVRILFHLLDARRRSRYAAEFDLFPRQALRALIRHLMISTSHSCSIMPREWLP